MTKNNKKELTKKELQEIIEKQKKIIEKQNNSKKVILVEKETGEVINKSSISKTLFNFLEERFASILEEEKTKKIKKNDKATKKDDDNISEETKRTLGGLQFVMSICDKHILIDDDYKNKIFSNELAFCDYVYSFVKEYNQVINKCNENTSYLNKLSLINKNEINCVNQIFFMPTEFYAKQVYHYSELVNSLQQKAIILGLDYRKF